jgi:sulfoxide reductase heme-binding subunit YedZ
MSLVAQHRSDRPLGGSSGDWGRRFLRFHVPLAVVSAAFLVSFMTLPLFDPLAYSRMDMESRSTVPQPMDMATARPEQQGGGAVHGGTEPAAAGGHGGSQTSAPSDHGAGPAQPSGHAGSQTPMPGQVPSAGHGAGGQVGATESDALTDRRAQSRFDQRLTVATGYLATMLLAFTLLVGPANLLLRRRNPVSSYLRRDAGMWAAAISVVHVIVGLQVHGSADLSGVLGYFFGRDGSPLLNSFGLANWIGLLGTVIVVGLLTISSDLALRTLKAPRWKLLQRLNYVLFALVVAHAIFYGALLRLTSPFTLMLFLSVIAVMAGQTTGIWLWRRRRSRTTPLAA